MRPRLGCRSFSYEVYRVMGADTPSAYPLLEAIRFDLTVSGPTLAAQGYDAAMVIVQKVAEAYFRKAYHGRLIMDRKDKAAREKAKSAKWGLSVGLFGHAIDSRTLAREELTGPLGKALGEHGFVLAAVGVKRAGEGVVRASVDDGTLERAIKRLVAGKPVTAAVMLGGLKEMQTDDRGRVTGYFGDGQKRPAYRNAAAGRDRAATAP